MDRSRARERQEGEREDLGSHPHQDPSLPQRSDLKSGPMLRVSRPRSSGLTLCSSTQQGQGRVAVDVSATFLRDRVHVPESLAQKLLVRRSKL